MKRESSAEKYWFYGAMAPFPFLYVALNPKDEKVEIPEDICNLKAKQYHVQGVGG